MDDYMEYNPGLFADGDYKKAYKRRIKSELKIQKTSNPERAQSNELEHRQLKFLNHTVFTDVWFFLGANYG